MGIALDHVCECTDMDRPSGSRAFVLGLSLVAMVVGCQAAGFPVPPEPPIPEEHMPMYASFGLRGDPAVAGSNLRLGVTILPDEIRLRSIDLPAGTVIRWSEGLSEGRIRLVSADPACELEVDLPPEQDVPILFRHDATTCSFEVSDPIDTGEAGHLSATVTAQPWNELIVEAISLDTPRQPVPDGVPPDEGGLAQLSPLYPGRYEIRLRHFDEILERQVIDVAPTGPQDSLIQLTLDGVPD